MSGLSDKYYLNFSLKNEHRELTDSDSGLTNIIIYSSSNEWFSIVEKKEPTGQKWTIMIWTYRNTVDISIGSTLPLGRTKKPLLG